MYAWSKNAMAECSMITKPIVYKIEKTGLWGEAVRQRRPVITNDYAAPDPAKKGYPEGHPHIIRHMNVPVIEDGHIVLVAGVANKPSDYSENDVSELLLLMQGLWTILKQKRAEEVKKKTDEELRLLKISTDNSSDQVFWLDFSGNFLYVNDTTCRDYGYTHEEFSSMKIFDLNPDLTREIWEMSVSDLRERKNQFITTQHRRRDGSIMDVEIVAVYVNQDHREYSFAYVRDITERKQTADKLKAAYEQVTAAEEELREQYEELASGEKKIRESEEKYRSLVDLSPVGVVVHREGRIIYANPEAVRLSGAATAEDIIGRDLLAFIHPDDIAMAREDFRQLHEEGRIIPLKEERLRRISGDPFTVEITAIPIQYRGTSFRTRHVPRHHGPETGGNRTPDDLRAPCGN